MTFIIVLFGTLLMVAGIAIVTNPENIFGPLAKNVDKAGLQFLAVVVRLILGALLVYLADQSRFPLVIEVLGWIAIAAALVLALMGRNNFIRLMKWALSVAKPYSRVGGVMAIAFGAFLVFAFI